MNTNAMNVSHSTTNVAVTIRRVRINLVELVEFVRMGSFPQVRSAFVNS